MNAPKGPTARRIVAYSRPTAATPINACGTRMLHELSPNSRTLRPMTQSAAGVLSTVRALPASKEPNSHACQSCALAIAAAE